MNNIAPAKTTRVISVDILRGITIFVMIFANFGFMGSPWFMRHYDYRAFSAATYVDYIFSMFLLLVGISIPLAFKKYGDSFKDNMQAIAHVIIRSASLLFIGLLLINQPNLEKMGDWSFMHGFWNWTGAENYTWVATCAWRALMTAGIILAFNKTTAEDYRWRRISLVLKIVGWGILIYYMIIFVPQYTQNIPLELQEKPLWYRAWRCVFFDQGNWLRGEWWEIIGLIGWGYLGASLAYLFVRKFPELLYLVITFFLIVTLSGMYGRFEGYEWLSRYAQRIGTYSFIVTLGVGAGTMLLRSSSNHKAMLSMMGKFLIMCLLLSALTTPLAGLGANGAEAEDLWYGSIYRFLFGLNKNENTLGWIFTTGVIGAALWMVFYIICDIWKRDNFILRFFRELGSVPLTAYIFQIFFFSVIFGTRVLVFSVDPEKSNMWVSLICSLTVTVVICLAAVLCKKKKFSLKL